MKKRFWVLDGLQVTLIITFCANDGNDTPERRTAQRTVQTVPTGIGRAH